jgi:hypothetical protein
MEDKKFITKEQKQIEDKYPKSCQLGVLVEIKREEGSEYLFDSLKLALEEENIENFKKTENYIRFNLPYDENYEYLLPESISGISDYFPPSPDTYKFFISISTKKDNYPRKILVCGKTSGFEIEPELSINEEYIWKIFGECYVLEKTNGDVDIFHLKLVLDKNDYNQITKVKINSEKINKQSSEVQNNRNLRTTIARFQKGN